MKKMLAVQVMVLSLPALKVNWVSGSPAEPWAVQKGLSVSLALRHQWRLQGFVGFSKPGQEHSGLVACNDREQDRTVRIKVGALSIYPLIKAHSSNTWVILPGKK